MEKIYLVALIVCLSMVVVAAGVGFYFYQQTAVKPAENNVNNSGLSDGNQSENSADKIKQQSLPLVLKADNQDFVKIWAIEKTNLGAKPSLHDLLDKTAQVFQNKINDSVKLVGLVYIVSKNINQNNYYRFDLRYQSQIRKWQSGRPVLYSVDYNYDFIKCADIQSNLSSACVNEGVSFEDMVMADSLNQTIIIVEPLNADSQIGLSNFLLVQSKDIKLDLSDILAKINGSSFKTINFTATTQGSMWTIPGVGKIKDDPQAVLEKLDIQK